MSTNRHRQPAAETTTTARRRDALRASHQDHLYLRRTVRLLRRSAGNAFSIAAQFRGSVKRTKPVPPQRVSNLALTSQPPTGGTYAHLASESSGNLAMASHSDGGENVWQRNYVTRIPIYPHHGMNVQQVSVRLTSFAFRATLLQFSRQYSLGQLPPHMQRYPISYACVTNVPALHRNGTDGAFNQYRYEYSDDIRRTQVSSFANNFLVMRSAQTSPNYHATSAR